MAAEHMSGPGTESTDTFVTGNYGVSTCAKTEWRFVVDESATPASLELCAAAARTHSTGRVGRCTHQLLCTQR